MNRKLSIAFSAALLILAHPGSAQACAACYGQSDSPLAAGMNWGIFSLMGMVAMVLGILSSFFVFLARRPNMTDNPPPVDDGKNKSESEHGNL